MYRLVELLDTYVAGRFCFVSVLSQSSPVAEVLNEPSTEAKQNAVIFSFQNMTLEEVRSLLLSIYKLHIISTLHALHRHMGQQNKKQTANIKQHS